MPGCFVGALTSATWGHRSVAVLAGVGQLLEARRHAKHDMHTTKLANRYQSARRKPGPAGTVRVPEKVPGMVTVPELAARLKISLTTAYRWVRSGKLIAQERGRLLQGPVDHVLGSRTPSPGR